MRRPLILAAHGTDSHAGRTSFARFVNAVRRAVKGAEVQDAFVDLEEPSIAEVLASTSGPRTVVPMMLFGDATAQSSITAAASDPLVTITPSLGPDWVLAEVGVRRLIEAGARPDDSILLATGVVSDAQAVEEVGRAARLLSAVWGGRVHVGTLGGPDTSLGDAVDIARAYGGRVVVASYVLTGGSVHDTFREVGADVVTAPLLDDEAPDPRLVDLVLAREQARSQSYADF